MKGKVENQDPSRAGNGSLNMSRMVGYIEHLHDCHGSILATVRIYVGSFDNANINVKETIRLGRVILSQEAI